MLNDSGVVVPGAAAVVGVPLVLAGCLRADAVSNGEPVRARAKFAAQVVGRLIWRHPWLLTAVLCGLVLVTGVRGPDLPADLRTWLIRAHGFVVWNDQWYAGHPTVGYSLLFPGIAVLTGVRIAGALSAIAAALAATRLVGRETTGSMRAGLLWFCIAVVTELVVGQLPFLLGVACATGAALAISRRRPVLAGCAAIACSLASPLAGAFLLLGAVAWASTGRWRAALPLGAAGVGVALAAVAGGGGTFPLSVVTLIPVVLLVALGLYLAPPSYRALRRGLVLYGGVAVVLAFVPTPVGGNIARLGALVGGPIAVAVLPRIRKRIWLALVVLPLVAWPAAPAVGAIAHNSQDPSRHSAYFSGLVSYLSAQRLPYGRVEIPMTRDHWEAAYVASVYPLARGWERQIDRRYNAVFYAPGPLAAEMYQGWLHDNAVRYIALPDVALDRAGTAEAMLIRSGSLADLRPVWQDAHWQVWALGHPTPFASGAGAMSALGVDTFTLRVRRPGTTLVRLHYSRMWRSQDPGVCISTSPDGWTQVTSGHAGDITVAARPTLAAFVGPLADNDSSGGAACASD